MAARSLGILHCVAPRWGVHASRHSHAHLSPSLARSVEQLFARVDGSSGSGSSGDDVQWMSETRWPNARLGVGEVATAPGSPLDPTTWATTKLGTYLRTGVITDSVITDSASGCELDRCPRHAERWISLPHVDPQGALDQPHYFQVSTHMGLRSWSRACVCECVRA